MREIAEVIGYAAIVIWLLGCLNVLDFELSISGHQVLASHQQEPTKSARSAR